MTCTRLFLFLFLLRGINAYSQCRTITKTGAITSSETWTKDNIYLLSDIASVEAPAVLTIEAGTVIFGDKPTKACLIIKPGAQIIANGTLTEPIVFTSAAPEGYRNPGDWKGLLILGNATVNTVNPCLEGFTTCTNYGGTDDNETSGSLKYVRIEYAGIALSPNNETNGLTLAGVGRGTTVESIQVSYSGDDGFEWFGGTVNCKNLVSYASWDDDFDCDLGYRGNVQFGVAIRQKYLADQSGSNGFEIDNDGSNSDNTPQTAPIFSNITILGPITKTGDAYSGNYKYGAHLRRNSAASIFNSAITGFYTGVVLDGTKTYANYNHVSTGVLDHNVIALSDYYNSATSSYDPIFYSEVGLTASSTQEYCETQKNNTSVPIHMLSSIPDWSSIGLSEPMFLGSTAASSYNPNFALTTGTLSSGADFTDAKFTSNTFFNNSITYRGAFGSTDWTDGWTEWDPQNKVYCLPTSILQPINETRYFKLYPNPTEDLFIISSLNNSEENIHVTIYNSQGQKIEEQDLHTGYAFSMKSDRYTKGLYLIQISQKNNSEQHKILLK